MSEYLFAYGTLRSGFGLVKVGTGSIQGTMYDLGEYPGAVPGEGEIIGDLFRSPRTFADLDEYEGEEFDRKTVRVTTEAGVVEAWIYWYTGDVSGRSPIEDKDYLNYLKSIKPK